VKTVAVYSPKGGVGKSTLSVHLAWTAATIAKRRTVLWDLDPQAASSWMLGDDGGGDRARAAFAKDGDLARRLRPTAWDRLMLMPADASLRGLDQLFHDLDKKKRLSRMVAALGDHDVVVLDCPPGLTETADQVIRAADLLVVPVVPSALSDRSLRAMADHVGATSRLLPVHSMVDRRRRLHLAALDAHPDWPQIPAASAIEAAAAARSVVGATTPRGAAATAFADLWQAIERRLAA
jgi:cellulose biosynthesis protein BcsQ